MPAGWKNSALSPGDVLLDKNKQAFVYLGYYREVSTRKEGFLYVGLIDAGNAPADMVGAPDEPRTVRYCVAHRFYRFVQRPVRFEARSGEIPAEALGTALSEIREYDRIGDRKPGASPYN